MNDSVTRMEIIGAVGSAFGGGAIGRDDLLTAARAGGARREVLDLLGGLPNERFREVRDLWVELHHLPLGV